MAQTFVREIRSAAPHSSAAPSFQVARSALQDPKYFLELAHGLRGLPRDKSVPPIQDRRSAISGFPARRNPIPKSSLQLYQTRHVPGLVSCLRDSACPCESGPPL